ncbi:inactive pancreatic lipase-related protein 1-like [Drosophila guanche]|uniref:Blast:Inactive pancreatic lipase-related protein 1 n=1 Tax=Drosophila guanche TaxID=7266 RepID=A0A3B0K6G9_DROGU|nr:inactive pancreatic lipase-related protein 1-like [Drosophila guanche]SPP88883.1 blast:Inactive pancreatic lipase-related protein 1 [Drosophila guanche]
MRTLQQRSSFMAGALRMWRSQSASCAPPTRPAGSSMKYLEAIPLVPGVGKDVAHFLNFLADKFSLDLSQVVMVAHSMGAHVAGFCGQRVSRYTPQLLLLGGTCDGIAPESVALGDPPEIGCTEGMYSFKTQAESPYGQPF